MNIEDLMERYPDLIFMDGFDDCIAGVIYGIDTPYKICYHSEKVICKLMDDGMNYDEALEYHEFNQLNAYVGEHSPVFLDES